VAPAPEETRTNHGTGSFPFRLMLHGAGIIIVRTVRELRDDPVLTRMCAPECGSGPSCEIPRGEQRPARSFFSEHQTTTPWIYGEEFPAPRRARGWLTPMPTTTDRRPPRSCRR